MSKHRWCDVANRHVKRAFCNVSHDVDGHVPDLRCPDGKRRAHRDRIVDGWTPLRLSDAAGGIQVTIANGNSGLASVTMFSGQLEKTGGIKSAGSGSVENS